MLCRKKHGYKQMTDEFFKDWFYDEPNFTNAWLCARSGIVANVQGLPSGVGLAFRPPTTAAD